MKDCIVLAMPLEFPESAEASRQGHRRHNCPVCKTMDEDERGQG